MEGSHHDWKGDPGDLRPGLFSPHLQRMSRALPGSCIRWVPAAPGFEIRELWYNITILCIRYTFPPSCSLPWLDLMTLPVQVHQMQGGGDRTLEKVTLLLLHRKHLDGYIVCYQK